MKKILIIEDDQDIAALQRDYLEADGFYVEIEENGKIGLEKALKEPSHPQYIETVWGAGYRLKI
jgi:DNA-binding response OmpR family regulator